MAPSEDGSSLVCSRALLGSAYASAATGCAAQWAMAQAEGLTVRAGQLPRPPSLVFDLELEDTVKNGCGSEEQEVGTSQLKRWLMPGSTGEFKLRNDVEQGLSQCECSDSQSALEANQTLATFLTRLGYFVHIRTALGGGDGFECLRNLRHVFLAVNPPGAAATTNRFVVDLSFKEQFRIAKPTPRYSSLLACLPEVFVAPEAAVAPLVNFLCQEMAFAFRATGVVLPPWRQTNSMLSKWLPRKSLDEQVPRSLPSAAGLPSGQAPAGPMPRRSMDMAAPVAQVYGHWMHPQAGHQLQQKAVAASAASMQQQAAQRRFQQGEGADAFGPSRRVGLVKPIVCEPKLKLVGGNFSSVGFT